MVDAAVEPVWRTNRRGRANLLPISENLPMLMALAMVDLSESQRETLVNLIYQQSVDLTALTSRQLRKFLITFFHAQRSSHESPLMSRRMVHSFVAISYGELGEYDGHSLKDKETGTSMRIMRGNATG